MRLGVALPPIGAPPSKLLADWRAKHPNVVLTVSEMNGRDMAAALEERRLDAALIQEFKLWPHASSLPICRERLIVALPVDQPSPRHVNPVHTLTLGALRGRMQPAVQPVKASVQRC